MLCKLVLLRNQCKVRVVFVMFLIAPNEEVSTSYLS